LQLNIAIVNEGSRMYSFSTAAALTVLVATTTASAPQTQAPPSPQGGFTLNAAASTTFAAIAAQDSMVEVALAGLALRKSGDSQLRHLAEKMVQDYAQYNDGLDSIVKCEGLILPFELDAKYSALIRRLDLKSGTVFEEAYLKHIAQRHTVTMAVFESASMSRDPDIAALAREGLSMLQEHQLLAKDLRAAIATKTVSTH